ncbi:MAG TPA: methionyl-tRNA formyltransferase [Phycisphaerales bacterium]|nr:methionyl-tRNA formyltransferase [Phycisphaerales bacterium]
MNIVYLGSGQFGIPSLEAIERSSHRIDLVVSQPASPAGRGRRPRPTPMAEWAAQRDMPLIETPCCDAPPVIERIAAAGPDLIVVIAFGQRIGRTLIDLPPRGIINVHASLLPKYRGAAPINWAIINGETRTGVSIITVCDRIDAGDVLAERATDIAPRETAGELHDRLAELAAPLLVETLDRIADGTATYTEQDHCRATAAPKLHKSAGLLDFNLPAEVVERRIRGLWPWPCACCTFHSAKTGRSIPVAIAAAEVVEPFDPTPRPPGMLDRDMCVVCGTGALQITRIKPACGRLMKFRDFVNGQHAACGDAFTSDLASL